MFRITRVLLLVIGCSLGLLAQNTLPPSPLEAALRQSGLHVSLTTSRSRTSEEFRLGLRNAAARLIQRIDRRESPPQQRAPELSSDHLVVAILDGEGVVRHWQIVVDPRIVRGEFPDAAGHLRQTLFYREDVELSVSAPAGIGAAEVRILRPNWDSGELRLDSVASVKTAPGVRE